MSNFLQSPEIKKPITRNQVIEAYKKIVEQGITNPDGLDEKDPEVAQANQLFYDWSAWLDKQTEVQEHKGEREAHPRNNLAKTMLYIDAGFTDPVYLNNVLSWLLQDAQNAEKQPDNLERTTTRQQIASAIKKVRDLLATQKK